ncbi:mRNA turnover protein 4 homolog [Chrysoperla carnea]|uniref:mRNA turnover protein 4 homolog n=1 Tax=Chrysoperla carnea TaxID=189513 RepID=UPI001D0695B2|nr:mRNA turnover protein 4 homolog [Chrysoperla carnea]
MPKSKRDKKISLTKTSKKGLALKQQIIDDIRRCVEKFSSVYMFSVQNMRNDKLKDLRIEWTNSRFFFGKNKIMAIGLGRTPETEVEDKLHELAVCLRGQCGLLFTDKPKEYVIDWFKNFEVEDFARSGFKATYDVSFPEGPLPQFSHAIEPYLRQLGMPTTLDKGVVTLLKDFEVCKMGSVLTPERAKILELFDIKMAAFKLILKCVWIKGVGFVKLKKSDDNDEDTDDEMEAEDDDED